MALSPRRVHSGGETEYIWEREGVDFLLAALPDTDPHHAWPLHELFEPSSGRLYEIDMLVLARTGLYLVEIKSHPGELTGDSQDWTFTDSSGIQRRLQNPLPFTNKKCKVLSSLLRRHFPGGSSAPYVHPIIFLSNETATANLDYGTPNWLVTRENVRDTLVLGLPNSRGGTVNRVTMDRVLDAFHEIGIRPSQTRRMIDGYKLDDLIAEGPGTQDHEAIHTHIEGDRVRVRSFLVPRATTQERKQALEKAARREAETLSRLGQHPRILSYKVFKPDAPLGPAIIFEAFEDAEPLDILLRRFPDLTFEDRLSLLTQLCEAIHHCHRSDVLHRNLSPAALLARFDDNGRPELRLDRFLIAARANQSSATIHIDEFSDPLERLYLAPEVLSDPKKATTASDLFSIGCIAYHLLTGKKPASQLIERNEFIRTEKLYPSKIQIDLSPFDEAIKRATQFYALDRGDDVMSWLDTYVLSRVIDPNAVASIDPYDAKRNDVIGGNLKVEKILGSGVAGRVFKVSRDDQVFALKVPHDEGCAERLRAEARVLAGIRHQNIVALHETLELGGRACLLLSFAGDDCLDRILRQEGVFDLDKARRYGEELLLAVQILEESGIVHRDIKPGNIGFSGLAKRKQRLTLFDFSLAGSDDASTGAGTPEWRDPWLYLRSRWDSAADRFSAAAVLYRMLTGLRPEVADEGPNRGEIQIEAERFDAGLRDRLSDFFKSCFASKVKNRFADSETMRKAWLDLFVQGSSESSSTMDVETFDFTVSATTTPIDALPLSIRARSVLDRAGVYDVAGLLQLPQNHLSAIRGCGVKVAREIVELAKKLREQHELSPAPQFFESYAGIQESLDSADLQLSPSQLEVLQDGAITNTVDLCSAPEDRIHNLLGVSESKKLKTQLEAREKAPSEEGSLDDWLQALVGKKPGKKLGVDRKRARMLIGLDDLPTGVIDPSPGARTIKLISTATKDAPQRVLGSLVKIRKEWTKNACLPALSELVEGVIEELGPVAELDEFARALIARRSSGQGVDEELLTTARALVRLCAELAEPVLYWRAMGGVTWFARDEKSLSLLKSLATQAGELARREPLPSSATTRNELKAIVKDSDFETLPPDRLIKLAASAATKVAVSARMELYPVGMSPDRALTLSLAALVPPGLTPELVRERVQARYPEAETLPGRPDLDALLDVHQLHYDPQANDYKRPGLAHMSASTVEMVTHYTSALPNEPRLRTPAALKAHAFNEALMKGVQAGRFRVIQVLATQAEQAAKVLAAKLGISPCSLDQLIWAGVQRAAVALEVDQANIVEADREGPSGENWPLLKELVETAATKQIDDLLKQRQRPQLLIHPGLLGRFGLSKQLEMLVQRSQHEDGAAVLLLVPSHDDGAAPSINGEISVPAPLPGQRLRLPRSWLENLHNARKGSKGEA